MSQKPILYLHIGASKTGSSAIQAFLNKNRAQLKWRGVFYPQAEILQMSDAINHSPFFLKLDRTPEPERKQLALRARIFLTKQVKEHSLTSVVLSHEGLDPRTPFIRELIGSGDFDVRIIVYIRRQDLWIEAGWKQWGVKRLDCETIDDWIVLTRTDPFWSIQLDWNRFIGRWEEMVPRENINVRVYEKEKLLNRDVVDDFMSAIGVCDLRGLARPDTRSSKETNRGYRPEVLTFVHRVRSVLINEHDNSLSEMFDEYLNDRHLIAPFEAYTLLDYGRRKEILRYYDQSNAQVLAKFFTNEHELFCTPTAEKHTPVSTEDIGELDAVPIIVELLLNQSKRIAQLSRVVENLEKHHSFQYHAISQRFPHFGRSIVASSKRINGNLIRKVRNVSNVCKLRNRINVVPETGHEPVVIEIPLGLSAKRWYRITIDVNSYTGISGRLWFLGNGRVGSNAVDYSIPYQMYGTRWRRSFSFWSTLDTDRIRFSYVPSGTTPIEVKFTISD